MSLMPLWSGAFNPSSGGVFGGGGGGGGGGGFDPGFDLDRAIGLGRDLLGFFHDDEEPQAPRGRGPTPTERFRTNVREMGGSQAGAVCSSEPFKRTACGTWVPQMHTEISPDGGSNVFLPISNAHLKRAIRSAARSSLSPAKKRCPK